MTKTLKQHYDMHKPGVYAIVEPDGSILFDTFANSAHGARAKLKSVSEPWSVSVDKGYAIHEFEAVARVARQPVEESAMNPAILPGVPATPTAWGLDDVPEAGDAARTLGESLSRLLREEAPEALLAHEDTRLAAANRVTAEMEALMGTLRPAGAADAEAIRTLHRLVNRVFRTG